jgi:hypothetical protein
MGEGDMKTAFYTRVGAVAPNRPELTGVAKGRLRATAPTGLVLAVLLCVTSAFAASPFDDSSRAAHAMLTRLCDDFGGRLTGSPANRGAMEQLATELRALGLQPEIVSFKMPGWERGADSVQLIAPFARPLRVAALAYTQPHKAFEAEVASIGAGNEADYPADVRGKVVLLDSTAVRVTREISRLASERGARGILYINREGGGQLLARTGSFIGEALPLPVYTLTQEEGRWLQRLLARGRPVRVRMETHSRCREVETANLRLVFPGRSAWARRSSSRWRTRCAAASWRARSNSTGSMAKSRACGARATRPPRSVTPRSWR